MISQFQTTFMYVLVFSHWLIIMSRARLKYLVHTTCMVTRAHDFVCRAHEINKTYTCHPCTTVHTRFSSMQSEMFLIVWKTIIKKVFIRHSTCWALKNPWFDTWRWHVRWSCGHQGGHMGSSGYFGFVLRRRAHARSHRCQQEWFTFVKYLVCQAL